MYRLFSRIPKGLEPVADAFKRHVEADGMALVKEATEAAAAKAAAGELLRRTCVPILLHAGPGVQCMSFTAHLGAVHHTLQAGEGGQAGAMQAQMCIA